MTTNVSSGNFLFTMLGIAALILMIFHWDAIDAAFLSWLSGIGTDIFVPAFASSEVITTSSTTI